MTEDANPTTFGKRVKAARKARRMTQQQLAAKIGMSQGNLSDIENGHVPTSTYTTAIAEALGIQATWLADGRGSREVAPSSERATADLGGTAPADAMRYRSPTEVPVVGTTQGGPPDRIWDELNFPTGYSDEYLQVSTPDPHAYALRVVGSSMAPRIMEGEWLLVEPTGEPQPGDDVVVKTTDGRVMVKTMLSRHGRQIILSSVNEAFERISIEDSEIEFIHFVAGRFAARSVKRRISDGINETRRIAPRQHDGGERRNVTLPPGLLIDPEGDHQQPAPRKRGGRAS